MADNEDQAEKPELDLDAIAQRASNIHASSRWLTRLLTEDVPAMIARIRELEAKDRSRGND
ncbi:hypothetical protein SEA_SKOG_137 [Gordonia phage Skog]|uniref:Uncharacterized protein n=1 Tax=Gordonia phage Skog TaxID=2704033 RepID=A0A6G6XJJ9_9CAUD|nr:hypothetical protein KHQ85_gp137 [Gordonia phage Skog]QIG58289.1 hypothetical protein SEA_SKOG_137 [Gordonia phage Skog]